MRFFSLAIFVWIFSFVKSQNNTLDSLKLALKNLPTGQAGAKHDTTRCNILSALTEVAPDGEWEKYNEQLKNIAETNLNNIPPTHSLYPIYKKYLASALNSIGFMYNNQSDNAKALEYYNKSLKIHEEIRDKQGIALSLSNIGLVYSNQGDITKALEYSHKSLKIKEEIGDKRGIASSLNNIGFMYENQGDTHKALEYLHKSVKIYEEVGDKKGLAYSLNNLGLNYNNQRDFSKALEYYNKSLKIREEIGDKLGLAQSLNNIGGVYNIQLDIPKALEYYNKSLKIREEIGDKHGLAYSLINIGFIYLLQKNYTKAIEFSTKSMMVSKEIGFPQNIKNAAQVLSGIYKKTGDYKHALENYELYIQMRDSINNEETKKASIKSQLKYEYEKKAAADSVKASEEKKVIDAQLKQEKTQRLALYGGLGLVGIFALFMVNRFRVTNKQKKLIEEQKEIVETQKHLVEEKQKEIIDSITYARRIQRALITNEHYISGALKRIKS